MSTVAAGIANALPPEQDTLQAALIAHTEAGAAQREDLAPGAPRSPPVGTFHALVVAASSPEPFPRNDLGSPLRADVELDEPPPLANYDATDGIFRCSHCGWEVTCEGRCSGCGNLFPVNGDLFPVDASLPLEPPAVGMGWLDSAVLDSLEYGTRDAPMSDAVLEPADERLRLQELGVPQQSIDEWEVSFDKVYGILICPGRCEGLTPPLQEDEIWQLSLGWHIQGVKTVDDFDELVEAVLDHVQGLPEPDGQWATVRTPRGWLTGMHDWDELKQREVWAMPYNEFSTENDPQETAGSEAGGTDESSDGSTSDLSADGSSDTASTEGDTPCALDELSFSAWPSQRTHLIDLPLEVLQLIASVSRYIQSNCPFPTVRPSTVPDAMAACGRRAAS
jgi:hypothetical protein